MTLPMNLTLVRHGLSEANRIQQFIKTKNKAGLLDLVDMKVVTERHDSTARLARAGVEQAEATGEWLRANLPTFDRHYVSPHIRTRETAAHLQLNGEWIVDDLFRERDWGELVPREDRSRSASELSRHLRKLNEWYWKRLHRREDVNNVIAVTHGESISVAQSAIDRFRERYWGKLVPREDLSGGPSELSRHLRKLNEWYWKPQGGESLATGVRARVEFVLQGLYRREDVNNVIAVTHGEFIRVAQFAIERLTPDMFNAMDHDPSFKVQNTMVVEYTRKNPNDETDIRNNFHWRRATCPWDESKSWANGEWVNFETPKHKDEDLLTFAESHPRYFSDES